MVLVNAIYFKGDWEDQFDANDTHAVPFHLLDGSQVSASMMNTHLSSVPYAARDDYQAVELPYQGGSAVMDMIVPEPGRFDAFESALDANLLEKLLAGMRPAALQLGVQNLFCLPM
jgi:serpin B